ncbi:hypothetical protein KKG71_04185 [Patescibacteria group bacterium]|nr:hypothetical protein [Patescibacteria group bacterium]
MRKFLLRTFFALTVVPFYVLALNYIFEEPTITWLYYSHVAVYFGFAVLLILAIWGIYKLKTWRISLLVVLAMVILLDVGLLIRGVNPYMIKFRKDYSADYGVINTPNMRTYVSYSNRNSGDLLEAYNLDPLSLPDIDFPLETHEFNYEIDSNGFRNESADEKKDILFIGDSLTIASSMEGEKGWPGVAGNLLNINGYNLGINQIGPANYLKILRHFSGDSKKAVIAFFEGNDFDKLYYEVGMNSDRTNLWYWINYIIEERRAGEIVATPAVSDFSVPIFRVGESEFPMIFYEHYVNNLQRSEEVIKGLDSYEEFKDVVVKMGAECRDNEMECVFLYIPTKLRVYIPYIKNQLNLSEMYKNLQKPITVYQDSVFYYKDVQEKIVKDLIEEYAPNMRYLSSTEALKDHAKNGELVYYPYDTHLNELGNRVLGELVAEFFSQ